MVDYKGCDPSHKRLCGCRQSPGVHRCPTADLRKRICRRPCAVMVDYEIFLGDAQSGGYVGWGFADYHKVSCGLDHILTLARCAEIPSAHLKGMRQIFQDLGFKKNGQQYYDIDLSGAGQTRRVRGVVTQSPSYKYVCIILYMILPNYYDIDIRQWHLLGPLGPHRTQRPLQGLTQPETQGKQRETTVLNTKLLNAFFVC